MTQWRTTDAARRKWSQHAPVEWTEPMGANRNEVLSGKTGVVGTIRPYNAGGHRGVFLRLSGVEFWQHNYVAGRNMWSGVRTFQTAKAAREFAAPIIEEMISPAS